MGSLGAKLRNLSGGSIGFWCPGCDEMHAFRVTSPGGGNWTFNNDLQLPTFSPSLLVTWRHPKGHTNANPAPADFNGEYIEERCHSFVRDGRILFLSDCTHALASKTVDIPDFPADFAT